MEILFLFLWFRFPTNHNFSQYIAAAPFHRQEIENIRTFGIENLLSTEMHSLSKQIDINILRSVKLLFRNAAYFMDFWFPKTYAWEEIVENVKKNKLEWTMNFLCSTKMVFKSLYLRTFGI